MQPGTRIHWTLVFPSREPMPTILPIQGQEASKPPRWLNLRQLGRMFNLTGPAMGKHLDALGYREDKRPSAKAMSAGVGRFLPSSMTQENPVVQWHSHHAVAALQHAGLVPVNGFAVFCRAAADKVHTHLLIVDQEPDPRPAEKWWITEQMQGHLEKVPGNQREAFIDALVEDIMARKRKVPLDLVHQLLGAMGQLEGHQARMLARHIEQSTAQVRSTGPARRL